MITLYYTKEFTGGLLKGLRVNESMTFVSIEAAEKYKAFGFKGCKKPIANGSPYKFIDASYQNYFRGTN